MTPERGPALSLAEIQQAAPSLPRNVQEHLFKQRADAGRVHRVAADYAQRLLDQTRAIRDKRLAEQRGAPDAVKQWDGEVDRLVATRGMSRIAAIKRLVTEQPTLHANYLAAVNDRQRTA